MWDACWGGGGGGKYKFLMVGGDRIIGLSEMYY